MNQPVNNNGMAISKLQHSGVTVWFTGLSGAGKRPQLAAL